MILSETWRVIRSCFWECILTTLAAGLLFTLGDVFLLTNLTLVSVGNQMKQESTLEIFFNDGVTHDHVASIREQVASYDGVTDIREKSPEQALDEMSSILGSDLTEIIGHNPLPYSLEVRFEPESYNVEYLDSLSSEIAILDEVMEIHFASDWIESLRRLIDMSTLVFILLSLMITVGALFIFLGLQRHVSRKRMSVVINLQLLGISQWTLQVSQLIWGFLVGLVSGLIGLGTTALLWMLFCEHVLAVPFFEKPIMMLTLALPVVISVISVIRRGASHNGRTPLRV